MVYSFNMKYYHTLIMTAVSIASSKLTRNSVNQLSLDAKEDAKRHSYFLLLINLFYTLVFTTLHIFLSLKYINLWAPKGA